jgi:hypothetical protein
MNIIPSDKLTVDMLPGVGADRQAFIKLAYTFNGYEALEDCAEFANRASAVFKEDGTLPGSLDELRACLFYEHRADYHGNFAMSGTVPPYYHALVAAMRKMIEKRQAE